MPDNVWPSEVPSFKDTFQELYATFDRTGPQGPEAIARYLKIDEDYFADTVRDGNSVLRLLHYPPQNEPTGEHIRAGAHEDINTITLLLGAEEAGLELLTKDGRWIPVSPKPGELVINIGDMLQRLTNGRLRSTSHRVVNPRPDRASQGALFDALLPALPLGLPDRAAAGHGPGGRAAEVAADHRRRISSGAAAGDQTRLSTSVCFRPKAAISRQRLGSHKKKAASNLEGADRLLASEKHLTLPRKSANSLNLAYAPNLLETP